MYVLVVRKLSHVKTQIRVRTGITRPEMKNSWRRPENVSGDSTVGVPEMPSYWPRIGYKKKYGKGGPDGCMSRSYVLNQRANNRETAFDLFS